MVAPKPPIRAPTSTQSAKSTKLPPINIFDITSRHITAMMIALHMKEYTVRKVGATKHVLQMADLDDHEIVCQHLKDAHAQHFTYTPTQRKNQSFILRGLDGDEDEAQVLADLQNLQLAAVEFVKVSKLTNNVARSNTLFVVQATAASVESTILKATKLSHVIVRWERLKRRDILQCRRCQRLGHTASNCGMQFRCVKCKEQHEPGQCGLPSGQIHEPHQVFCIACNKFGHPASYRGCPQIKSFKESIARKKAAAQQEAQLRRQCVDNYTRPNVSFRDAVSGRPTAPARNVNGSPESSSAPTPAPASATTPAAPTPIDPALTELLRQIVAAAMVPIEEALRKQAERVNQIYETFFLEP